MSRMVIVSFLTIFLFLTPIASAIHTIKAPGVIYEVKYSVVSNGTVVLIPLSVFQYDFLCCPNSSIAKFGEWYYLLYYDGSQLYLLNFTYALAHPLRVAFVNGSWYVEISTYKDSCDEITSSVYSLNLANFSFKKVNTSWSRLVWNSQSVNEINGWKIVIPNLSTNSSFPTTVDIIVINSKENANLLNNSKRVVLTTSPKFPVYFLLRKGNRIRNITLVYINTTPVSWIEYGSRRVTGISGYWFPENIKVIRIGPKGELHVPFWNVKVLNAQYSIVSSGKDAIIYLSISVLSPYCPPHLVASGYNCSNTSEVTIMGGGEYLLYFNDSKLYLLNFLKPYNTVIESYNGAVFVNGSWYLNITFFNRSNLRFVDKIYQFNSRDFCIKPVNVNWSRLLEESKNINTINGWRIVTFDQQSSDRWGLAPIYTVCASPFKEAIKLNYPCKSLIIQKFVKIPIQFILERSETERNITMAYFEMNSTSADYKLSKDIIPVDIPFCQQSKSERRESTSKEKNETTTSSTTSTTSPTPKEKHKICEPGVIVLLPLISIIISRIRRR